MKTTAQPGIPLISRVASMLAIWAFALAALVILPATAHATAAGNFGGSDAKTTQQAADTPAAPQPSTHPSHPAVLLTGYVLTLLGAAVCIRTLRKPQVRQEDS